MSEEAQTRVITFLGRGCAELHGDEIHLKICPHCSQWNSPAASHTSRCEWCGYEPSLEHAQPASDGS